MALTSIQDKVPINGTLVTMGVHGKAALAEQIYDDDLKDFQSNINKRLKEDIENAQPTLKTINGESLLGEGNIEINVDSTLYIAVDSLPAAPVSGNEHKIHLIKTSRTDETDKFDEFIWKEDAWEQIGQASVTVDLSNYYTKTESDTAFITQQELDGELQDYETRLTNLDNNKEDKGNGIVEGVFDSDSYELQLLKTKKADGTQGEAIIDMSSIKTDIEEVQTNINTLRTELIGEDGESGVVRTIAHSEAVVVMEEYVSGGDSTTDEKINALDSELSDGTQVIVTIVQEQGKLSLLTVNDGPIDSRLSTTEAAVNGIDTRVSTIEESLITSDDVDTKISDAINGLGADLDDGNLVNVAITQEAGKISTITVDESSLTDALDNNFVTINGNSTKTGNLKIVGDLSIGSAAEDYGSITAEGVADFTDLKIAGYKVLPVIIDGEAGSTANAEYTKLTEAITNNQPLFVNLITSDSYGTQMVPLRWMAGSGGSYYLYAELPRIGSSGVVTGYTSYKREINSNGWVDDAWVTRESLCVISIAQADYDALETKDDVLYVIKE